ncbi:PEP-CTERM sorting domain-containing protein [Pseudoduganella umbonata]|nr:PEP-CTERM sorting domain-containing protein [Pseudoduganella umbonata]
MITEDSVAANIPELASWTSHPWFEKSADGVKVHLYFPGVTGAYTITGSAAAGALDGVTTWRGALDRLFLEPGFKFDYIYEGYEEVEGYAFSFTGNFIPEIAAPVPEPGAAAMTIAGLFVVGAAARRRRKIRQRDIYSVAMTLDNLQRA